MTAARSALELSNVVRRFGSVVAVNNVSLSVGKGEFVTLLGPSGSGKTSTLRLIGGFEELDGGSIRLNGERIDHLPAYQRDTATIFQSGALFPHKTVAENVAYGLRMRKVAKDEMAKRIAQSLDTVRLKGFENRYPAQLSGGQKQRIAIARAFLRQAPILILDEATSSIDSATESRLQKALEILLTGRTAFVVAHRLSTIRHADQVLVLDHGRIVERGTHDQLVEKRGLYFDLFERQNLQGELI